MFPNKESFLVNYGISIQYFFQRLKYSIPSRLGFPGAPNTRSHEQKIEESIQLFYEMYEKFSLSKTKLDLECHNHFQEIRFQLDMHREKLKEKIDDIYMKMIQNTKGYEASYLKSLEEKLGSSLKPFEFKSYDKDFVDLEETFRNSNL